MQVYTFFVVMVFFVIFLGLMAFALFSPPYYEDEDIEDEHFEDEE